MFKNDGFEEGPKMSIALIFACVWVLAATLVALLPMRRQLVPGVALLIAAPVLIGVIWVQHGIWFGLPAVFAFLSMFRRPLWHLYRRVSGEKLELPK